MTATTAIGILALAAVAVLVALLVGANRGRRRAESVPPGMRPAYSDEELEKVVIERYMGWGLVFTLIFAIGFPVYWVYEERRINQAQEDFIVADVQQGEEEYRQACAECHGAEMGGGATADPYGEGSWPAPALNNIAARYQDNPNVVDIEEFVFDTIARGRPGTPMPTWAAEYGGAMTDHQIEAITRYILLNQLDPEEAAVEADSATNVSGEELYTQNCAKCHGADLEGIAAPPLIGVFARHERGSVLGILRNGIIVPGGPNMPPWQAGYQYADARFTDEALERIIDYLEERQPDDVEERRDQEALGTPPEPEDDADDEDDETGEPDDEATEA